MTHWVAKYTPEQRKAIVDAVIDGGLSAPKAVKAAKAGQLDGIAAFEIPVTTARDLVWKEKQRRREHEEARAAAEDPRAAVQAIVAQLLGEANGLLKTLRAGETNTAERWEELRVAARAVREIEAAARAVHRDAAGNGGQGNGDAEPEQPAGLIERLAAGAGETATAGPGSTNPAGTHEEREQGAATPAETTDHGPTLQEREAERTKNGVRVGAAGNVDERPSEREEAAARARAVLEARV
jgi:hypothetical protein